MESNFYKTNIYWYGHLIRILFTQMIKKISFSVTLLSIDYIFSLYCYLLKLKLHKFNKKTHMKSKAYCF